MQRSVSNGIASQSQLPGETALPPRGGKFSFPPLGGGSSGDSRHFGTPTFSWLGSFPLRHRPMQTLLGWCDTN